MENANIMPVYDVNGNANGGAWFMWFILLLCLGGWNGGRNGAGLTQVEMQQGFDTQSILRKLDGIQNGLCDGFYAQNSTMLQGFNGTQREILDSRYQLGNQIAENRFAQQQCCCELKAEGYRNTCEITNAIHAEGEATRALIQHNVMQELRDKLADRDRDLMSANFQLSQLSQTANIVGTLRPFPQPAYITCSPYQQAVNNCAYNGCGC